MPDAHEQQLQSLIADVAAQTLSFPVLKTLCRARSAGLSLDAHHFEMIALSFGRKAEAVAKLDLFVAGLLTPSESGDLQLCEGLSCRGRGASELHEFILPRLHSGHGIERIDCLDNCQGGPSMAFNGLLYSGAAEDLSRDERSWRYGQGA
ncbi:MAG: hypothetical protein V3W41_06165 [Planctomycetota bacterium]